MVRVRGSRWVALVLSAAMVMPNSLVLAADGPKTPGPAERVRPVVDDVALSREGVLEGVVVNGSGATVAGTDVSIMQENKEVAHAKTAKDGRFTVPGMRGGVYRISSGSGSGTFRLWSQDAAPPVARQLAMVVADANVVRGQMPLNKLFTTQAFVITTIVAAAIAIPLAIHNSRDDDDSGS